MPLSVRREAMASTRREQGWPRGWLVGAIAGSVAVMGAAADAGGFRALALVGGWLVALGVAGWRLGADSRDGRDWKPLALKPLKSFDWLEQPVYAPSRLEEPS